jgi:hypothetical protein
MSTEDHSAGRSLLAEMTELREQMESLRKAMGLLVDLQRELNVHLTKQPQEARFFGDAESVLSIDRA